MISLMNGSGPVPGIMSKRWLIPLAAFSLLLTISFAAGLYPGGAEMVDPEIGLEVQRTWSSSEGPEGMAPVSGKTWQYVDVDMRNLNKGSSVQISVPHFFARADGGERLWVHNSEDFSYPALGQGENVTVHLLFMVERGLVLKELEYIQRVSGPVRCEIPEI